MPTANFPQLQSLVPQDSQTIALQALLTAFADVPALRAEVGALWGEIDRLSALAMPARKPEQWLTLAETAKILRCSEKTITRHIARGRLRKSMLSRRVRIPAEDVESFAGKALVPR